jgi:hypothetical protein
MSVMWGRGKNCLASTGLGLRKFCEKFLDTLEVCRTSNRQSDGVRVLNL